MRWWLACSVFVVGCYQPSLQPGSPCDESHPCPAGLVCAPTTPPTCQTSVDLDASIIDPGDTVLIDGCTPVPEICGDGIDQDCDGNDPACPANDLPGGAIDVTAGGMFTADLRYATDDAAKPTNGPAFCGISGGRDLYYKITITADETYYIDTFGSDFNSLIRVYHGACVTGAAPSAAKCRNDQCSTSNAQGVFDLTSGVTCIVVDQNSSAETDGALKLHVERGHRTGTPIATGTQSTMGTTVGATDQTSSTCTQAGPDVGYYFTACPAETLAVSATTCNAVTLFNSAVYLKRPGLADVCNDDDATCTGNPVASRISTSVTGAHLYYLVVDTSVAGASGPFQLDTTIQ